MPRRGGGGRSGGFGGGFNRSSSPPRRTAAAAAAPRPRAAAGPGITSGLGGVMLQGMAFGAGSEIAHQAVRGVMGSGHSSQGSEAAPAQMQMQTQDVCSAQNYDFMQCLQTNPEHIGTCQSYLDLYKQCRQVQQ